jgi:hypothetical protein
MRRFALFLTFCCLAAVMPTHLAAQSFRLRANIPFAFVMDGKTMPAGEYAIEAGTVMQGTVIIRNDDRHAAAIAPILVPTDPGVTENSAASLRFNHYGNQYFLAQVWPGFDGTGLELNTSAEERKTAKQESANKPEAVTVLAMR